MCLTKKIVHLYISDIMPHKNKVFNSKVIVSKLELLIHLKLELTQFELNELALTCKDRRLEPLLDLESIGGRLLVAPRPARRLLSREGLRAQIKAWKDETVNTPSLFSVFFVALDTWVKRDCKQSKLAF